MKSIALLVMIVALCCGGANAARAQSGRVPVPRDTNITHVLYLADGSTLVGKLLSRDSVSIHFETNGGVLTVPIDRVKELRPVAPADVRGKEYWFPDANETRLFFAPTGRMLKKGEGYYSNTYLFLQTFVGAPTDKFTLGGGFSIVPAPDFFQNNFYYVAPKLGLYNSPKTNVAVGLLAGVFPGESSNSSSAGILYAVGTQGGPGASVTAGLGFGFQNGDLQSRPALMLGGATRVSRRVALVTENYGFWTHENELVGCGQFSCTYRSGNKFFGLVSAGVRFLGEKLSTDFALWNATDLDVFPGIPYVAFAVKF